ncbi:alpha,alpha-trehalase TreA [Pantoea sp. Nvir]|uniref:alpha,alpha-trehalase TreA n=1 Tax=Pantoea sp. Nvir TaxID=2576760 RepID=UPI00135BC05E|nr:alpha,alpha-trehalase TreA [Pantoea sp. Nvir]MXP66233.1 alpha,alpha-trehalase TreA [Pantoea sp. Nvir]
MKKLFLTTLFKRQGVAPFVVLTLLFYQPALTTQADDNIQHMLSNHPKPPDIRFGELFEEVQNAQLYTDQKTFADAVPKYDPSLIIADWKRQRNQRNFDLKNFILNNFTLPDESNKYVPSTGYSLRAHINSLWPVLTRTTKSTGRYDSLLPLPKPYVVPGGRFREFYYWDSYFTMLGLAESKRWDLVQNMVDNFAWEIDHYGHIPNGNRSYYLSRSQPPFFSLMVELLATHVGDVIYTKYLPQLHKEYNYWMADSNSVSAGQASKRVVKLADNTLLNRYWDDRAVPRTESWLDDVNTAKKAPQRDKSEIYRDLRTGAASGWDFSSRWFSEPYNITSIRTTQLAPVDLNSLIFHLEQTLAKAYQINKQQDKAKQFDNLAEKRQAAVNHYLWDEKHGWYADYDIKNKYVVSERLTAATLFPLYMQLASDKQADRTASAVENQLLKTGGLLTTTVNNGQQWDAPNGWAPLQWVAIAGLEHYNKPQLAQQIGLRFLKNVQTTYDKDHKLVEKYVVDGPNLGGGSGGEYPLQDGFGWTNGVTLMLLDKYCPKEKSCNNAQDIPQISIMKK